eukprot:9119791-Alexandrium_andersonii.AAC.1
MGACLASDKTLTFVIGVMPMTLTLHVDGMCKTRRRHRRCWASSRRMWASFNERMPIPYNMRDKTTER